MAKKEILNRTAKQWGIEPMRKPDPKETPLSFEEMKKGWEMGAFAKPTEADEIDEWPVVQKHKAAGQWKTTVKQPRSVWSGL